MKMRGSFTRLQSGVTTNASASPTTMPPTARKRNCRPASAREKPVPTATARATRKAARPVASLIRLSPPTTVLTRSGTPRRRKIASAATGSVGDRMAPSTNATGQESPTA